MFAISHHAGINAAGPLYWALRHRPAMYISIQHPKVVPMEAPSSGTDVHTGEEQRTCHWRDGRLQPEDLYDSMHNQLCKDASGGKGKRTSVFGRKDGPRGQAEQITAPPTIPSLPPYKALPPNAFYANSRWFYRPVPEPGPLLCSSTTYNYKEWPTGKCGERAEVKCLTCVKFDPTRLGRFCARCFREKHPWYRVPHHVVDIEEDDNVVEWEIAKQVHRAEWDRYGHGISVCLDDVRKLHTQLSNHATRMKVERACGSTAVKLRDSERTIRNARKWQRRELSAREQYEQALTHSRITDATIAARRLWDGIHAIRASSTIQRIYRGWRTRRRLRSTTV